jgi:hypothetical protein
MTIQGQLELDKSVTLHEEYGTVGIRAIVLPKKVPKDANEKDDDTPLDLEGDELYLSSGANALGSYLEASKGGRRCVVFLVNGQRQDFLDNAFIVQQLGFKYLRNRMMIAVDVDGLSPEAIGELMQGSRQGFFKGSAWEAIIRRLVATLKDDPDLVRLEEEAEQQISELRSGDEKVKEALDQLIDDHHDKGQHIVTGGLGAGGDSKSDDMFGFTTVRKGEVVSLVPPDHGAPADLPVLTTKPDANSIRLKPDEERTFHLKSRPGNAWAALADISVEVEPKVPELALKIDRQAERAAIKLIFNQPKGFDPDHYPIRATIVAHARFNGIKEPRRLEIGVLIKPDKEPRPPELRDPPTFLKVSTRQPVPIKQGSTDTHVRLKWDGFDSLALGDNPAWTFRARRKGLVTEQPKMTFSTPSDGRLTLLISPRPEWEVGKQLQFTVEAVGPSQKVLAAAFDAEVIAKPEEPEEVKREPRILKAEVPHGSNRRPPYVLKYVTEDQWESTPCWDAENFTGDDPGCFTTPTARDPLTLIINEDMTLLKDYRKYITDKSTAEAEVTRRVNKYTSHIGYHLYQMYQASLDQEKDQDADVRNRAEIQRVAGTLIKLMEIAR